MTSDEAAAETPYECYLRLPDLLALQRPRTAERQPTQWADEHFFIAVHQSAEVLAGQALVDLEMARQPAPDRDPDLGSDPGPDADPGTDRQSRTLACVRRVTAIVDLLEQHLAVLEHLSPEGFAAFRPLLDNASGAQSSQFATLFAVIDETASHRPSQRPGTSAGTSGAAGGPDGDEAAQAWWALRSAVARWRTRHLLLVERMIGDRPGTGGTSGLAYLRSRIALPPYDTDAAEPGTGTGPCPGPGPGRGSGPGPV